MTFTLVF